MGLEFVNDFCCHWLVGLLAQPVDLIHDEQALISRNRLRYVHRLF